MLRIIAVSIVLSATMLAALLLTAFADPQITYEQLSASGADQGYYTQIRTYRYSTGTSYAYFYLTGPSTYYYCYGYDVESVVNINRSVEEGSASLNTGHLNYYNNHCTPHVDVAVECNSTGQYHEKFVGSRIVQTPAGIFSVEEQRKLSHATCSVAIDSLGLALNDIPGVMESNGF